MIIRIVKLQLKPDYTALFCQKFDEINHQITAMPGCEGVSLLRDINNPSLFFTKSYWQTQADLEAYRNSDFFNLTWSLVKPFFAARAEAWSLQEV